MERRGTVACALIAVFALSVGAASSPSLDSEVARGIQQFEEGYYDEAVVTLGAAIERLTRDSSKTSEVERAHVYLGAASVALGQRTRAKKEFRSAIQSMVQQPGGKRRKIKELTLASFDFSPKVTEVFEEAKREARAEAGERDSDSKLPFILVGAGAVAGGAALAAKGSTVADVAPGFILQSMGLGDAKSIPVGVPQSQPAAIVQVTAITFSVENGGSIYASPTWNFGDGTTASGSPVTHVYQSEGSFTVTASGSGGHTVTSSVLVRGLTGTWGAPDAPCCWGQLHITQVGTSLSGDDGYGYPSGQRGPLTGTVRSPRAIHLDLGGDCHAVLDGFASDGVDAIAFIVTSQDARCGDSGYWVVSWLRQ